MKVGQRLFLAVIPAVLGVFTVALLAYFGQYARTAPEALVVHRDVIAAVGLAGGCVAQHALRRAAH